MSEPHTSELNCIYYYYLVYMAYILDAVIAGGCLWNISKIFVQLGFSDSQHHIGVGADWLVRFWAEHFFGD